jgi:hypothetical protein
MLLIEYITGSTFNSLLLVLAMTRDIARTIKHELNVISVMDPTRSISYATPRTSNNDMNVMSDI